MDHLKYPIIFGCYDKPDKVLIVGKDKQLGGYTLSVCRLEKDANYGDAIELKDCGDILAQMNFCKLESAKAFLESMKYLVEEMEKEHDREGV